MTDTEWIPVEKPPLGKVKNLREEWLASLKVGDKVAIKHKNYISHNKTFCSVDEIKAISPDGLITTDIFPYEFQYGMVIHDVWDSQTHVLTPVTKAEITEMEERHELETYFDDIDLRELSIEKLRKIKAILEEAENK